MTFLVKRISKNVSINCPSFYSEAHVYFFVRFLIVCLCVFQNLFRLKDVLLL